MHNKKFWGLIILIFLAAGIFQALSFHKGHLPNFAFLGFENFEYLQFQEAAKLSNARAIYIESTEDLSKIPDRSILLINSMGKSYTLLQSNQILKARKRGLAIINFYPLKKDTFTNVNFLAYRRILNYYNHGSLQNYTGLIKFLIRDFCSLKIKVPPVLELSLPKDNFETKRWISGVKDCLEYLKQETLNIGSKPRVVFLTTNISPQNHFNRIMLEKIISRLELENFAVFPLFKIPPQQLQEILKFIRPDIIICSAHGRVFPASLSAEFLKVIDAPFFLAANILESYSFWLKDKRAMIYPLLVQSLVIPEIDGVIEPLATAVLSPRVKNDSAQKNLLILEPIEERINKLIKRAKRWVALRKKNNFDKKVAIIYPAGFGRSDSGIGSLDLAPSLLNLLRELKNNGYNTGVLPENKAAFLALVEKEGLLYGSWAQGNYRKFLRENKFAVKVSIDNYKKWIKNNLSIALGAQLMRDTQSSAEFVIPVLKFGNIVILPQPAVSSLAKGKIAVHNITETPADLYVATYLWIKEGFGADALIHFGTHGTLEFIAGKEVFLSENDWSDALITDLPHGYVYIVDDVAEALIAKRRSLAVILSHQSPALVESGLYADLKNIFNASHAYFNTDNEALKQGYIKIVSTGIRKTKLATFLALKEFEKRLLSEEELKEIHDRIHSLSEELIPVGKHIYGTLPEEDLLIEMVYTMLGESFQEHLSQAQDDNQHDKQHSHTHGQHSHAHQANSHALDEDLRIRAKNIIKDLLKNNSTQVVLAKYAKVSQDLLMDLEKAKEFIKNIRSSGQEILACIRFLNGKYISPSMGGDPVFNPGSLPTGKNLYGVNPDIIPTLPAWEAGKQSADKLMEKYFKEEKRPLRKVAFTLWGVNTVIDQGITEAQILWLIGARPKYDSANNVYDIELIPIKELGRARIDVVIQVSGEYRDIFASRLELLAKAIKLAAQDKDQKQENFIQQNIKIVESQLRARGFSAQDAKTFAGERIFGPVNGGYGTSARSFYKNTATWDNSIEIAQSHVSSMSGLYSAKFWGVPQKELFASVLKNTDLVVQARSSQRTGGPLSLDHTYEFSGGLSLAIRALSNREPKNYFSDNRDLDNPKILTLREAVFNEASTRLWNPKFLQGMMDSGQSGARELKDYTGNLLGWSISKPDDILEDFWQKTFEVYFNDENQIGLDKFFNENEPFAYQDVAGIMLETIRKGYWHPEIDTKDKIMQTYVKLASENGLSCSVRTCGNAKMNQFVDNYFSHNKDTATSASRIYFKKYLANLESALGDRLKTNLNDDQNSEIVLPKISVIKKDGQSQ